MRNETRAAIIATAALAAGAPGCGGGERAPSPSAARPGFVRVVDNPWFPLRPGMRWRYRGHDGHTPTVDVVDATSATKRIQGVDATAVRDRLYSRGRLSEETTDWYAQDAHGTVWYFGEATRELDAHGRTTSTEGSWQAGRDGAEAGIFMPADPRVGRRYRQEYLRGQAEDHFAVVAVGPRRLVTHEWSPLERGVLDQKLYGRGVGDVREDSLTGGNEHLHLVTVRRR